MGYVIVFIAGMATMVYLLAPSIEAFTNWTNQRLQEEHDSHTKILDAYVEATARR